MRPACAAHTLPVLVRYAARARCIYGYAPLYTSPERHSSIHDAASPNSRIAGIKSWLSFGLRDSFVST